MKTISLLAAGCLIGYVASLLFSCRTTHVSGIIPNSGASPIGCYYPNDTFYGLSARDFVYCVERYKTTHDDLINQNLSSTYLSAAPPIVDARNCWFPLDTLIKFLYLVQKYSANLGLNHTQEGVRFYYAAYPHDISSLGEIVPGNYWCHHTLFMMPTYADSIGNNIDFDPRVSLRSVASILTPMDPQFISGTLMYLDLGGPNLPRTNSTTSTSIMAKNQEHLCPPNCNDSATLDEIDLKLSKGVTYATND